MIHLDANYLVDALVPGSPAALKIDGWISATEPLGMSAVAWGEFLRSPITPAAESAAREVVATLDSLLPRMPNWPPNSFNQTGRRSGSFQDCLIGRRHSVRRATRHFEWKCGAITNANKALVVLQTPSLLQA